MPFTSFTKMALACAIFATLQPLSSLAASADPTESRAEKVAHKHLFKRYPRLSEAPKGVPALVTHATYAKQNRLGLTVVTFHQSFMGIPVYQKKASVLVKADNTVASTRQNLVFTAPENKFANDDALGAQAISAVKLGFAELGYNVDAALGGGPLEVVVSSTDHALNLEASRVKLEKIWYDQLGELVPALKFTVAFDDSVAQKHIDHGFIVAHHNEDSQPYILEQGSQQSHASHEYTVFAGDTGDLLTTNTYGATPRFYPLIGLPDFSVDPFPYTPPSIHNRSFSSISTSDPWLSPERGAQFGTSGNHANVCIQTPFGQAPATSENCGREGWESVPYSSDRAFNWQYNPNNPLSHESRRASAVNLFYLYNQLHDFFYDFGFDEAAQTAQRDNYGRGGEQGDPLNVFVMDSTAFNNASARTGEDGRSPIISMHPFITQRRLFSSQFGITLNANLNEGLPNEVSRNEKLVGVAYSYLGQQVFDDVSGETIALEFEGEDGCSPLLSLDNVKDKIAMYPIETCEINDENEVIQNNMAALKQAGAVGIVFGVDGQVIQQYQNTVPFSARFNNPLPHMFLSLDELFFEIFYDPFLCDDSGEQCAPYTLTLNSLERPVVRDSALGHAISIHEWGHYLTTRLVGSTILARSQYRALLEGWADFLAVFFMIQSQDNQVAGNENWGGSYSLSDWAINRSYTGLRRIPYTTDFRRNALTLENIRNDAEFSPAALGHTVIRNRNPNSEAHNAGEVWATVLLEAYVALLNENPRLTFEQAQTRMMMYVITSMQLLDIGVTFSEAREAFLSVAYAHDREDYDVLKRAFARRGMGVSFTSPSSFSSTFFGAQNSFDVDFQALQSFSTGLDFQTSIEDIINFKDLFNDSIDTDLSDFRAQVAQALPACASQDDVRYGFLLAGYISVGDEDIDAFDILVSETSGQHLLFANNGAFKIDGLTYDGNVDVVVPFAYLRSAENVNSMVHVTVSGGQDLRLPEPEVYDTIFRFDADSNNAPALPIDCQLGRTLQGVSQTDAATVTFNQNVFTFFEGAGRQEQVQTITVTNTSNARQHFTLSNQVSNDAQGIEIRYPRALHVPANSSRTFELRAVNRAKQLQRGRSTVNGAIELKSEGSTLVVPYSVRSIK